MNITIEQAADFLKSNDNYTILCHVHPDGDTLGSGYALRYALELMGKGARVLCAEETSSRFDFLLNPDEKRTFDENAAETVVAVDVADEELLGDYQKVYGGRVGLCIDHHVSNKMYADMTLLDDKAAACAEIIWRVIKRLGVKPTDLIAAAVYTGISTDTGCFKFANTTPDSHIITAELMGYNLDISHINYIMFDMKTPERVKLEQQALSDIEYYFNGQCAVIVLSAAMLENADVEDTNGISALPRQVYGVEVGVVLREKEQRLWKASLRSSGKVDVQNICAGFGGGGHTRAAGCTLKGGLGEVKKTLLGEIGKQFAE